MSKAIRWQVPFASQSGTRYRVDIYDEGYTGAPVTLQAGEHPFFSCENDSDDYFEPVRSQTGSMEICSILPDGSRLTPDDLLPVNNIARPVRLINLSNDNAIEWQGFLSCEAYSQNYTAIPENITLSLISVLEAMDSVQVNTMHFTGAIAGHRMLYYILNDLQTACGMTSMFNYIYYSRTSWRILRQYFDTNDFFDIKEVWDEARLNYQLDGISLKDLLGRLCKFMGWVAREQGRSIFLSRINDTGAMYRITLGWLYMNTFYQMHTQVDYTATNIADMEWMGTDHKRDIRQGARSVEVVANLTDFDADMGLPDYLMSDQTDAYEQEAAKDSSTTVYIENYLDKDNTAYTRCTFAYHYGYYSKMDGYAPTYRYDGVASQADFIANIFLRGKTFNRAFLSGDKTFYAGAIPIRYASKEEANTTPDSYEQGLYCTFLPGIEGTHTPIFSMKNPKPVSLYSGYLHITANAYFIGSVITRSWLSYATFSESRSPFDYQTVLACTLRVGNLYWNGGSWSSTSVPFFLLMTDSGINEYIPVPTVLFGQMELTIQPYISAGPNITENSSQIFELLFKSFDVSYAPGSSPLFNDRKSNQYFLSLSASFRDTVSVDCDFSTYNHNIPSPSLVITNPSLNNENRYLKELQYTFASGSENKRIEKDLLNRLAAFYSAARTRLTLITKHPTLAPLPLLTLNGINDGKTYAPLAESRDWQTEEVTLTCIENP